MPRWSIPQQANTGGTVVIGTNNVTIGFPEWDFSGLYVKCLSMRNHGPAPAFGAMVVEASPDKTWWETLDSSTFNTLGSNVNKSVQFVNDAHTYFRIRGNAPAGSVATVMYWWTF